jgi:uncharacterized protein YndB with AHSA1/START domain
MRGLSASRYIDAPPDRVWQVISDVTRTGEWSPVCHRCEWVGESADHQVGARFRGYNREGPIRWSRECVVTAAEPGRAFGFTTLVDGRESTHWLYELTEEGPGTLVRESYEPVYAPRYVSPSWSSTSFMI